MLGLWRPVCSGTTRFGTTNGKRALPSRGATQPRRLSSSQDASFLERRSANHAPLTPLTFLERTAAVFPSRTAIVYDDWKAVAASAREEGGDESAPSFRQSWSETYRRCRRLASALAKIGVQKGDTVAILSPNTPAFVEAHFGVNMAGAVLNPLNIRLDDETLAYILGHSGAKVLLTDSAFVSLASAAVDKMVSNGCDSRPLIIEIVDPIPSLAAAAAAEGSADTVPYESFLADGDESYPWSPPDDEWDTQAINYTSGTTGRPKGVLYHHRGAALNAMNNSLVWGMGQHPSYLWTLPMFHCNGWCFPYTVTLQAGTHVCLRAVDPGAIFEAISSQGVTHMCGAPVVMNMLLHATEEEKAPFLRRRRRKGSIPSEDKDEDVDDGVRIFTAGAPPPASVIQGMEGLGFDVTHVYGLTEVYGPAVSCPWNADEWDGLDAPSRAKIKARQGVKYPLLEDMCVVTEEHEIDPSLSETNDDDHAISECPIPPNWRHVPRDGTTMGEIMMRGNVVMKGYLHDADATEAAFDGGWFHTGDLAVVHPDGYVEIRDRKKDIIISGGENVSTVEVEDVLFSHEDVLEGSVVARRDEHWGETPCAFVMLKDGREWVDGETDKDIINFCRDHLAHFKAPKHVVHMPQGLPKTSTGKVQKFELRNLAKDVDSGS